MSFDNGTFFFLRYSIFMRKFTLTAQLGRDLFCVCSEVIYRWSDNWSDIYDSIRIYFSSYSPSVWVSRFLYLGHYGPPSW